MVGFMRTRFKRLRQAMLCPSFFFGGKRESESFFSASLRYLTFVVSGRSGKASYKGSSVNPPHMHPLQTYKSPDSNRKTNQSIYSFVSIPSNSASQTFQRTNNKHPLPPRQPRPPLHRLMHRRHHQARRHTPHLSDRRENCRALSNLCRLVPTAHDIDRCTTD